MLKIQNLSSSEAEIFLFEELDWKCSSKLFALIVGICSENAI
jgi:hypothetical protein